MPFTPAHPAIILPFLRLSPRLVSATGLVAGSVAPDFEYFLKFSVDGIHGHTLWGSLYFDIPVALALAFAFHGVVKNNFITNLPVSFQSRLQPTRSLDFKSYFRKHWIITILSCWIGALSHIFWDGFTHNSGYFAQRLPVYNDTFFNFFGTKYPLTFMLQHLSTIAGLSIILIYFYLMKPLTASGLNKPKSGYWLIVAGITFSVVLIRFLVRSHDLNLGNVVVATISGLCIAVMIAGIVKKYSNA